MYLHFFVIFLSFLNIELVFANTVHHRHFIYSNADENLVLEARNVGEYERQVFHAELEKMESEDSDKMMESYAKHLLACSSVGSKFTKQLQQSIGEMASDPEKNSMEEKSQRILRTIGFDVTASRMFTLPSDEIKSLIKMACLKHELQFQCADAFVDNKMKIRNNIERMKATDGNIKIMFERECSVNGGDLPKIYACIGSSAPEIHVACSSQISVFNRSRTLLNNRIHSTYRNTMEEISIVEENVDENAKQTNEMKKLQKLETTLDEIKNMEAFRCRLYKNLEECAVDTMVDLCGEEVREVAQTSMRVGQLRKERGDSMHEDFAEMEIQPHKNCEPYL